MVVSDYELFLSRRIRVDARAMDPNITVSKWASSRRMIKPPGWSTFELFNFDKTPYLIRPCDLLSKYSACKTLVVTKGSRLGFTQGVIMNSMFYNIDVNPVKMMYVSADQKLLNNFTKVELKPQLDASGLSYKIRPGSQNLKNKNRSSGESADLWEFGTDGYLCLYGANNPNNFRQLGAQFTYKDERATYPIFEKEGDVADLVDGRRRDYGEYGKDVIISTPTLAGTSFHKEFLAGSQEQWQVPCPLCGGLQMLEFGKIEKDEEGNKKLIYGLQFEYEDYQIVSEVRYKCRHCGESFPESEKYNLNILGSWVPQKKNFINPEYVSMEIQSIASNMQSWRNIADEFLKAKREGTPSKLHAFHNTVLGQFWEYKARRLTIQDLKQRKSGYCRSEVPEPVGMITAAVDVQGNRLEAEFKGWAKDKENFSIEYVTLHGDTNHFEVWNELEELIFTKRFGGLEPKMWVIDSGDGNKKDRVFDFVRMVNNRFTNEYLAKLPQGKRDPKIRLYKAYSLKGMTPKQLSRAEFRAVDISPDLKHINVNTYFYKELVMTWMSHHAPENMEDKKPHGYCNFPNDYPAKYFNQLKSEKMEITTDGSGHEQKKWVMINTRNEALDLFVYNAMAVDYFFEKIVKPLEDQTGIGTYNQMIEKFKQERNRSTV
jgi:phage terminase large subunit GpA-like protein